MKKISTLLMFVVLGVIAVSAQNVSTIAEFLSLEEGTEATLTLTDVQVNFADGDGLVAVQDATGGIVLVDSELDVKQGQRLNGTITGKYSEGNNGYAELEVTDESDVEVCKGELVVKEITPAEAADNILRLVKITDAYYDVELVDIMGFLFYPGIEKDDEQLMIFDAFETKATEDFDDEEDGVTLFGLPIAPASFADFGISVAIAPVVIEPTEPDVITVNTIAGFIALGEKEVARLNLTDAQVNFTDGEGLVAIQDETAGIMLTNTGVVAEQGQRLTGSIVGQFTMDMEYPHLIATDDTYASDIEVSDGELEVKEVSIAEAKEPENIMRLVQVSDAYYSSELIEVFSGLITFAGIEKDDEQLLLYDILYANTGYTSELDDEVDGITIAGLPFAPESFEMYGAETHALMPVKVPGTGTATSIQHVKEVLKNGAVYNLNGVRTDNPQKGVYIQNGRKIVIK